MLLDTIVLNKDSCRLELLSIYALSMAWFYTLNLYYTQKLPKRLHYIAILICIFYTLLLLCEVAHS